MSNKFKRLRSLKPLVEVYFFKPLTRRMFFLLLIFVLTFCFIDYANTEKKVRTIHDYGTYRISSKKVTGFITVTAEWWVKKFLTSVDRISFDYWGESYQLGDISNDEFVVVNVCVSSDKDDQGNGIYARHKSHIIVPIKDLPLKKGYSYKSGDEKLDPKAMNPGYSLISYANGILTIKERQLSNWTMWSCYLPERQQTQEFIELKIKSNPELTKVESIQFKLYEQRKIVDVDTSLAKRAMIYYWGKKQLLAEAKSTGEWEIEAEEINAEE